jgi:hypothetical protein
MTAAVTGAVARRQFIQAAGALGASACATVRRTPDAHVDVLDHRFGVRRTTGSRPVDTLPGLQRAEAEAFRRGLPLWLPAGVYAFRGVFRLRVPLRSEAAVLRPLGAQSTDTITVSGVSGLVIEGLTIECGGATMGLHLYQANRVIVRACRVVDARGGGIGVYLSDDVVIDDCIIDGVRNHGPAGDGIYFGGCARCVVRHNVIRNAGRIGIVSEGYAGSTPTRSEGTRVLHNVIEGSDPSGLAASETNAGIWFENTNAGEITDNVIRSLGSRPGVRGIQAVGAGTSKPSRFLVTRNIVEVGTAATPVGSGIVMGGSGNLASVYLDGNIIRNVNAAVYVAGGLREVYVSDLFVANLGVVDSSCGIVVLDHAGTAAVHLQGLRWSHIDDRMDGSNNWQHVNFFAGGVKRLTIRDVHGLGIATRGDAAEIDEISIADSTILFGTASGYGALNARRVTMTDVIVKPMLSPDPEARRADLFAPSSVARIVTCTRCRFEGWRFDPADDPGISLKCSACTFR